MDLSGYTLTTLHQDGEFGLWRGRALVSPAPDLPSVLVSIPTSEHPAPDLVRMLEHQLALRAELDSTWAVRPLVISHYRGRPALVLEDQPGEPLTRLLANLPVSHPSPAVPSAEPGMELGLFLRLGVGLARVLGEVHRRGFVHKNVKPSHVLVNAVTGQVWLTGFGIASRVPRERQAPEPPETIAGTLAYMAPEQTGRMNRSVDSRSDLYALGVTLYQMLTGSLPFVASAPIEWVHCHIARQPIPPSQRLNVPAPVSAIVMKLLAKTGDERYQTAAGLERDLRCCLTQWEARERVDDFSLGEHDIPDGLLISEKLYGRAAQVETLLAAFDRVVRSGAPELVLVSGHPGIGKSSVVNELHKVLVPPRGLFASGKFDQYKRDIPYSTLAQAFQHLIRPLLAKGEDELDRWRHALREALGPNAQLMVDLVPDLRTILGELPPVPEVPPQDAQRRFQFVFRRFLSVFARPEHPLALFLDDLQWLDAATLDLLQDLLTHGDVRHVLLIGAYRDNEVTRVHPLTRKLEAIRGTGATPVQEIALAPLGREDVCRLIADSFCCDAERATPLAQLVNEKTAGNPFFVIQFLSVLADEHLITFDHDAARWSWDLARIRAKGYTDNVVDLMVGKLERLPVRTQRVLQQLACVGDSADLARLILVREGSEAELRQDLQDALKTELVLHADGAYRFLHDRVREGAYSSIPETERAAAHLRIGRLLVAQTPAKDREAAIFEIANQLNSAVTLISTRTEKEQLAELNLIAGRRAKASTAYASALKYLTTGTSLLSDDGWEHRPDLMFALELNRAECEFLTNERATAETRLTMLSLRAANPVDQAAVVCLQIELYTTLDQNDRAVDVSLTYLQRLGIELSPRPTAEEARREYERVGSLLEHREIEELIALPLTRDPQFVAIVDVLTRVLTAAFYTDANLTSLISCRIVNLSLEHGNADGSCFGYSNLGMIAGPRFGDYKTGFRFGRLGYDLAERHQLLRFRARVATFFAALIIPWTRHLRTATELTRRAVDSAHATGELRWAAYACGDLIANRLAIGDPLPDIQREAEQSQEFIRKADFGIAYDNITTMLALVRTLRGLTTTFGCFDRTGFDERAFERHVTSDASVPMVACWYWIRKTQARFLAGDYESALEASLKALPLLWTSSSFFETAEAHFYGALSRAALCETATPDARRQHLEAVNVHHRQLVGWAENCRENFENRALLAGAEIARIEGRELDAERLYEGAIRAAREHSFVQNEAIANELAARFYANRGFERIARAYLREARDCYGQWGADGKVRQLEGQYPFLADEHPSADPTGTVMTSVEQLDLSTVLKLSQAVQGKTDLDELIAAVMRLGLEHAGAERGLLILPHGDGYRIEAEARSGNEGVTVDLHQTSITAGNLPQSVLQYVLRTRDRVLLQDATVEDRFSDDGYLRDHHARSVLCIPLLKQSRLAGILYFENNLTAGAFTPARMALLEVLASDAAISLENSRLYQDVTALKDQLYKENLVLRDEVDRTSMFEEIVGTSAALQPVLARVAKVARTDSTVLITGETGTGKELVARAIHRRSARASRAFVSVNCAAVPRELIASELFGHERGAFTGATQRRLGRFELAHAGTIFLDEVGELPMETQVALLRVLQEREFERVGGSTSIRVDVRVVAATNRDLQAAIESGTFRSDLFYRLNVFPIAVPALRERADDIPLLVEYFIERYARKAGKTIRRINTRTLDRLRSYPWPGNVRELQNVIERSVIVCDTAEFTVDESWVAARPGIEGRRALSGSVAAHEKAVIEDALRASGGRVFGPSGAAARLGIARSTLESKISALGIDKNRFRRRRATR